MDGDLADWDQTLVIERVPHELAFDRQWENIGGASPRPLSRRDLQFTAYTAWDNKAWYFAVDVEDDVVIEVPRSWRSAYSGDCFEVFVALAESEASVDIADLVHQGPADQAAFYQLTLAPAALPEPLDHLPRYRTNVGLRKRLAEGGFEVATARTPSGWRAEARLPLRALDDAARDTVKGGRLFKLALDYLDYDGKSAPAGGFSPDNVFCHDPDPLQVSVPRLMRWARFRR